MELMDFEAKQYIPFEQSIQVLDAEMRHQRGMPQKCQIGCPVQKVPFWDVWGCFKIVVISI